MGDLIAAIGIGLLGPFSRETKALAPKRRIACGRSRMYRIAEKKKQQQASVSMELQGSSRIP
jgi:hypothetical protein